MTGTYRMGNDGRWELVPETEQLIRDEVKRVLLGAADRMQGYYGTPRDTMSPNAYYSAIAIWEAAEGIKNYYGESSPPPYPYRPW